MRVWVTEECTGCGLCETTCPDVFQLNDQASVKEDADLAANEELVRQAADECPVEAIQVEEG
ncbi:MAG: ferredoxin [Candidatus Abyssobacteria bacterium SURF_17]|uniref:Ferredoxin n=1 Tax=Candidatus Abyssobacteria bacterium SURF_17 TaxID=2093361 RepID=A0A419EZR7_9BACT|nr:MAG: ferredoxin [Candidatus Abyssubacteria bacterium SURF_17]